MEWTATAEPVRLFLVGLSEGVARSVARYVSGDPRIALAGVAPSLSLAGMLLAATGAELALLDWSALGGSSREAVQALRLGCPGLHIVCVANDAEAYRAAASQAGIDAVISKDDFAGELESLLRGFFPGRVRA